MTEWHDKLKTLGYTCLELTSDSPHYETEELMQHTVLIATPEKIDSLLRFQEGMKDLVARVTLLMVDEIHTIADQSRGACLEAVIMRFFASHPRILAATATCPNISDANRTMVIYPRSSLFMQKLWITVSTSANHKDQCLSKGVGFHHAGVSPVDRRLVEEAFVDGCIPVLVSTSTLSMGINLPAHLVIIKNTALYVEGSTQEYTTRQMLQMIGRAGRPQFSTSATAVIMTTSAKKEYYEHWLEDAESVESSLHTCLIDHLNVEVALGRIQSMQDVNQWISGTYLAVRLVKNPLYYGSNRFQTTASMDLKRLCLDTLDKLKSIGALKVSADNQAIAPCLTGKLMCEHFLSASTMESFLCLTGSETILDLIHYVAGCAEMHEISIRSQEKSQLNRINRATGIQRLRYPTKGRITTPQMKVVTLLQAELNDFVVLEAGLHQESSKALKVFTRCAAGLRNLLWATTSSGSWDAGTLDADNPPPPATMGFACMAHVIELAKVVSYRVWADAPLASLRQLPDVGKEYANQLAGAGVVSLKDIERLGPRMLERILNRKPPFGDRVYESAVGVPKYELAAEQVATAAPDYVEFEFTVRLIRACKFDQVALIVGDDKNRVIFKTVLSTTLIESSGQWSHRVVVHHESEVRLLFTSLISFNFLGIDLNINFPIPWLEPCTGGTDRGLTTTLANISQALPVTVSPYIPSSPASVNLKKERKKETPKTCRSKQAKPSAPLFSTPKGVCSSLKQANIRTFFKTTKSHSEQVDSRLGIGEGKSGKQLADISPIPNTANLPSTPALNISAISTPHTQMPPETPFAGDPPSLPPSSLIQTPSEVAPKKAKWEQDADDRISPETDKMVEEELCSFLASVEATEEERSGFIHYRQLDYTISPIFPVDMDESYDHTTCLKPTNLPEPNAYNSTTIRSPEKVVGSVQPKQSPDSFKTPKEMQLHTSLDDVCESTRRVDPPIFMVPTSITPLRRLLKTQNSLLTRTPSTVKLSKKVSFSSLLLRKSDSACCDTGYISSPQPSTSKKSQNSVNSMEAMAVKEVDKLASPVFAVQETTEEGLLKRQEMGVLKSEARPSRMLDFQLLQEGWDQLATFIFCYNILEKLDSSSAEFVAISAPRTPPHNPTDSAYPSTDVHVASADVAADDFSPNGNNEHKHSHQQKFIVESGNQDTGCQHQVEE
uniref:DNA 3'-5' helicase n=1 Tax=Echinococcus granulosus TaxID=6210 RepID=A0A068W6T3_ECHGR|nr:ATP dependent DNA helicase HFM1 [Echinococcus granulosus]